MARSDSNNDETLFFGEFLETAISLSPFPDCPDIETASNSDSTYRLVFEELQCVCVDYPSLNPPTGSFDSLCCDRSGPASIRLPLSIYPEAYTERLCRGIELALAADCLESSLGPGVPSEGTTQRWHPPEFPSTPGPAIQDEDESLLGLPSVWTIFAWIAFAACSLVLLGLVFLLFAPFCRSSKEKVVTESDNQNREEEHEIEFEREEEDEISESKMKSDLMEQESPIIELDAPVEEQIHDLDGMDGDEDEEFIDATADAGYDEYDEESLGEDQEDV